MPLSFLANSLQLFEQLGEGAFGRVFKGLAKGIAGHKEPSIVAVKMLKGRWIMMVGSI